MKICGTVRRPLRAIISARASGRSSTLMTSYAAPLRSRRLRARAQKGHQSVKYMTILSSAMTLTSGLRQRQVLGAPRGNAASQIERLGESLCSELPHCRCSEGAGVIVHKYDFFLLLLQRLIGLEYLLARHLAGAGHVARGESFRGTQVNDHGTLVHQPNRLLRGNRCEVLVPGPQFVDDNQQSRNKRAA